MNIVVNPTDIKRLQEKAVDYTRFAFILLAVSVFLYVGILLPVEGKEPYQNDVLMAGTLFILAVAFIFVKRAIELKKIITESEKH